MAVDTAVAEIPGRRRAEQKLEVEYGMGGRGKDEAQSQECKFV
jgi:hypothetical protein